MQSSYAVVGTEGKSENKELLTQQQDQAESAKPNDESSLELIGGTSGEDEIEQDSIVDDSVSKYNFILYFLYKFKYEEVETP